jgi:hypothetical protein
MQETKKPVYQIRVFKNKTENQINGGYLAQQSIFGSDLHFSALNNQVEYGVGSQGPTNRGVQHSLLHELENA